MDNSKTATQSPLRSNIFKPSDFKKLSKNGAAFSSSFIGSSRRTDQQYGEKYDQDTNSNQQPNGYILGDNGLAL